jgi:hypothetical protein
MVIQDLALHALPWKTNNTSPSIDNRLAEIITIDNFPDFMVLAIADPRGDAGALASIARPIPIVDGRPLKFLRVAWQVRPSRAAAKRNRVYETDSLVIFPPSLDDQPVQGQWYDTSFQANQVSKFFQADIVKSQDATTKKYTYGWKDSAVSDGALYRPDEWNPAVVDSTYDFDAKTSTMLQVNGHPMGMSAIPSNVNNWSRTVQGQPHQPFVNLQAQAHLMVPGAFEIDYQVSLYWSDNPNFQ